MRIAPPAPLRPDLLVQREETGALAVYDPLLERVHALDADEAAALAEPPVELRARLEAALLVEGPAVEAVRDQRLAARLAAPPPPPPSPRVPEVDWGLAEDLPDGLSPRWRDGEALRRLAEDRAAGAEVLVLRTFLAPAFAEVCAREVRAMAMERLDTAVVAGHRRRVEGGLQALRDLLGAADTRTLLGAVLGRPLPAGLVVNAWRLEPGDHLRPHSDGPDYRATFALGLNPGWTAADGGAIAFGPPGADGRLAVGQRFLPQLGDLCLFLPRADRWHVVEPPARTRWTVSGWWIA